MLNDTNQLIDHNPQGCVIILILHINDLLDMQAAASIKFPTSQGGKFGKPTQSKVR